ncbi:uncharacterized protein [Montipora foliosa]|uniref:uncharacterized protein isoform X3 n=1 Tax=Montipora foliosa TaxID=591990 RepID=UPI0035F1B52A
MEIIYQGIVLLLFFSFLKAENQSAPPNPECKGMNTAAKNLEGGIRLALKTSPHCKPNEQCTGVKCTWPTNGFLEVDLHYCNSPVTYRVYFKQDYNKEKNFTLKQQDEQVLYKSNLFGTFKIKVNTLHRSGNTVTTNVGLLVCHQIFPGQKCHTISLMPEQTFCVQMDKCPGFNASVDHYTPCTYNPTQPHSYNQSTPSPGIRTNTAGPTSDFKTVTSGPSPDVRTNTTGPTSDFKTVTSGPSPDVRTNTTGPTSDFKTVTSGPSPDVRTNTTAPDPPPGGNLPYNKQDRKGHRGDSSKDLSTGAIIGICAAVLFVIFVVVGVSVYWKKYHHRYRLRAAYYNDISMHDPLCEDFGPEVA